MAIIDKRPTNDADNIKETAQCIAKILGEGNDVEQMLDTVLTQSDDDDDGYTLTKLMEEDYGIHASSRVVNAIDEGLKQSCDRLMKKVFAWVARNDIKPKFNVDDKVHFTDNSGQMREGKINDVYAQYAIYAVRLIENGLPINSGYMIRFEDLHPLEHADQRKELTPV